MFLRDTGNPTKLKHIVYLGAAMILGLLLSFIAHALIEMSYLSWAERQNITVKFYWGCALPPVLQGSLILAGVTGGLILGRLWWRKIYVEHIWAQRFKINNKEDDGHNDHRS